MKIDYFFFVSTKCLVVSTKCLVVSTKCLVVSADCFGVCVCTFEQDAKSIAAAKIVIIAFISIIVAQFKKFTIQSKNSLKTV